MHRLLNSALLVSRHSLYTNYMKMSTKTALVLLAPGSEDMEFVISVDVLRRSGVAVTVAGLDSKDPTTCSNGVVVVPDQKLSEAVTSGPFDVVVLPGGLKGSKSFAESQSLGILLKDQEKSGRLVAAICAAPTALKAHCIGFGKHITSYPSFKADLEDKYTYSDQNVVVDGNLITSRGPGTAFEFALTVAESLVGKEKRDAVAEGLLLK